MTPVRKGFVDVPHGQVHFRYGGSGPLVVLLHDFPRSSAYFASDIEWLGEHFSVVCPDTPGCGMSTALPSAEPDLGDFAQTLRSAFDALGIDRCALYGHRAGAGIALRFAADNPSRCALVLLDGLSVAAVAPGQDALRRGPPSFEPTADGSHLARTWSRILDLHRYSPWFETTAAARVQRDLPDDLALHEFATDLLVSEATGSAACAAWLRQAPTALVATLRARTVFLCREDDPTVARVDTPPGPLPDACSIERIPAGGPGWRTQVLALLRTAGLPGSRWSPPAVAPQLPTDAERQRYVDLVHGAVHVRLRGTAGAATPVLLVHDVPGGSATLAVTAGVLAQSRRTIAPDLPGLGESHPVPYPSLGSYVSILGEVMDRLGVEVVDVVAEGLGTCFAIAFAAHRPTRVRRLVLDGLPRLRKKDHGRLARHYCPPLTPDRHGAYLQHIWHQLREAQMSWPWFDRTAAAARIHDADLDPVSMHHALVDVMKQLPSYGDAARAALGAAVHEILRAVRQPTLLLEDARDVRYAGTAGALRRLAAGRIVARPTTARARAELAAEFLD